MKGDTIWKHIEILRWSIIRILVILFIITIVIFTYKDFIFDKIIIAPCSNNFITYKWLSDISSLLSLSSIDSQIKDIDIININLASQLAIHISMSFYLAFILIFPYIIIEIWLYISPALYSHEKRTALIGVISIILLFYFGLALSYFIIFPLTLTFLGNYQVSDLVSNHISLNSYITTFNTLSFMLGLVFETPIVAYFFGKTGVLRSHFLRRHWKIALVIVLTLAAIITPSTDIFTMLIVALPLMLLYELSIIVLKKAEPKV